MSPASSRTGFNGQLHESATHWQMLGNGYRVYSPVLMRFFSPDSLSPFDEGGLNAYAYAGDPINHADLSGHSAVPLLGVMMAVGALAVGGGAVATTVASGSRLNREVLWVVAGILAVGAVAVGLHAMRTKQGQMRILRRDDKDVVLVHGLPNRTAVGNAELDGTELAAALQSKGVGERPIKLVSCYSANGPASQGRVLANATGQPVTAYVGEVRFNELIGKVLWGSRIKFYPETGIAAANVAIRNHALNRGRGRPVAVRLPSGWLSGHSWRAGQSEPTLPPFPT
jgi:RHS repeat-associated protein